MNREITTAEKVGKLPHSDHPSLIMIRGLPGSGKSYLAAALRTALGKERVVLLDPDSIDQTSQDYAHFSAVLSAEGVDTKFHPYRFSRAKAFAAIKAHKIIIWNQPFIDFDGFRKTVEKLQTFASEQHTELPTLLVEVEITKHLAQTRVATRKEQGGHGPDENVFARFINQYGSFSERGYTTIIVNGESDVSQSVASVIEALKTL